VRTLALVFLFLAVTLVPASAYQPLTRTYCEKAKLAWDETANVCAATAQATEPLPAAETAVAGQPLTKTDCKKVGMRWSDGANVCEDSSKSSPVADQLSPATPSVVINIDKANQRMAVFLGGIKLHDWPVSTGLRGYTTPSGTYTATSMNKIWYSKQWDNAPMPHSVFFTKEGHAIHGTYEVKRLGKPASHGCVRLSPDNAATLYGLVAKHGLKNTQVVLAGSTPGGEGKKIANIARAKPHYRQPPRRSFKRGTESYAQFDNLSQGGAGSSDASLVGSKSRSEYRRGQDRKSVV
jgi:lipoprotein-anchoring transpeptidase ErfK/SrfK